MNIQINKYKISLIDEPSYSQDSMEAVRGYRSELCRHDAYDPCCAHGVIVGDIESPETSTIILGTGGATGVHKNSIAHTEKICFVAAGDSVFALEVIDFNNDKYRINIRNGKIDKQ